MAPKAKLVAFHPVHGYKIKPPQDLKTIKRNERERKRVEVVNNGFEALRKHVPTAAPVKKMSKVGILNEAMEYIQYLKTVLVTSSSPSTEPVLLNYTQHIPAHPMPFTPFPQPSPVSPQMPQLQSPASFSHSPYTQTHNSDQGFVSDYSQPSPAWHTPHTPQFTGHTPHHHHDYHHSNQQVPHVSSSSHYQNLKYAQDAESSGDEDDILDAIAEWQQH